MTSLVLPGEILDQASLPNPSNPSKSLKLGPGLQKLSSSEIRSVVAGTLVTDNKKNAAWVEVPEGRYIPTLNDPVLVLVQRSSADSFLCTLSPYSPPALLPHLAFEGVSKKTRPQLSPGTLVYARITSASSRRQSDVEISCVDPNTGRGDGLGELKGGMVFDVSLAFARRLLVSKQREKAGVAVLEELAERIPFEVAVGRNGRVWVNAEGRGGGGGGGGGGGASGGSGIRETLLVGKALVETDRGMLGLEEQRKLVKRLLKSLG